MMIYNSRNYKVFIDTAAQNVFDAIYNSRNYKVFIDGWGLDAEGL